MAIEDPESRPVGPAAMKEKYPGYGKWRDFHHPLTNGEIAFEIQPDKTVKAKITIGGQIRLNFADCLPVGWKITGYDYLVEEGERMGRFPGWRGFNTLPDFKLITAGGQKNFIVEDPRSILDLLHEIGHAHDAEDRPELIEKLKQAEKSFKELKPGEIRIPTADEKAVRHERNKTAARIRSDLERSAWAYALGQLRRIDPEVRREVFGDIQAVRDYLDEMLASHRGDFEARFRPEDDPEFSAKLKKLFDRNQGK